MRKTNGRVTPAVLETIKRMWRTNKPTKTIAVATGLNVQTVQKWILKLETENQVEVNQVGRKRLVNAERRREIQLAISSNNALTAVGIKELLPFHLKCSVATIKRELKGIGISRKRLKPVVATQNSPKVISKRFAYCTQISSLSDHDLIFFNETGFNLHVSSHYGYAPSACTLYITVPTQRGRNLSLKCAISVDGCLAYRLIVGSFNATLMTKWC